MIRIISIILSVFYINSVLAGEADCVQLRDSDQRNLCMAKNTRSVTYCAAINNEDNRRYCRAQLGSGQADCVAISNQQLRQYCLGVTR